MKIIAVMSPKGGIGKTTTLILYDTIQEKNPELCGFTAEEFDKEENK